VLLLGSLGDALGGSEYLRLIHHQERGLLPEVDFAQELAVQRACRDLIHAGLVNSAHDCSEGGLAVALVESALGTITPLRPGGLGTVVSIPVPAHHRIDGVLFGESQSRIIITIQDDKIESATKILTSSSAMWTVIGRVGGERLIVSVSSSDATPPSGTGSSAATAQPSGSPVIDIDLPALHHAWRFGLSRQMGEESCR
jgi:phosphoribosylformylglycinamidine (FGAM) synthase-like enzyme